MVYNASVHDGSEHCQWGLTCILEDLGPALARGWESALIQEMEMFIGTSFAWYDTYRPTIRERFSTVAREMKMWMETEGRCFRCNRWHMETVEGTSGTNVKTLDVGFWSPAGLHLKDVLFPHVTCGYRARTINVVSFEVL